jgi:hypothetical protein
MSSTTKSLSDAQREVLTAAAVRADGMLLPLPATIRARGGARRNLLAALLKLDVVEEVPVDDATGGWRTDDNGMLIGLRLTAAGLAAVGLPAAATAPSETDVGDTVPADPQTDAAASVAGDAVEMVPEAQGAATDQDADSTMPRRPTGKLGAVLQAISAATGATLSEVTTLTGWLPHTARAAVTGLRQRGFPIALIQQDGRKAYRLTDAG